MKGKIIVNEETRIKYLAFAFDDTDNNPDENKLAIDLLKQLASQYGKVISCGIVVYVKLKDDYLDYESSILKSIVAEFNFLWDQRKNL